MFCRIKGRSYGVLVCFLVLSLLFGTRGLATEKDGDKQGNAEKQEKKAETSVQKNDGKDADSSYDFSVENASLTTHTVLIGKEQLSYEAEAATYVLKNGEGKAKARIFYTAYTKKDVDDSSQRPVTFAFNGGPGSSSIWLHMGAFGPKKVKLDKDGFAGPPPAQIVDNPYSILDVTDLVFIDPVTTGYSRAVEEKTAKEFHGVEKDIESVGEFVRLYVTRKGRWLSPKYLSGESYGTLRASALVSYMSRRFNMAFSGLILVSSILDYQTVSFNTGNELPYVLFLPTYTATAWHYKKLSKDLQKLTLRQAVEKARDFAANEYLTALFQGNAMSKEDRAALIKKISDFTGLDEGFIDDANLRVSLFSYTKLILKDEKKIVGRMDSRYSGLAMDRISNWSEYDPSLSYLFAPFSESFNHYVRNDLKFKSDLPYEVLTGKTRPWDWKPFHNTYVNVLPRLAQTYTANPYLRIFIANGYFDGATPFMATEYTFDHMTPAAFSKNVTMKYYEGGHMMYTREKCLKKLKTDLARWLND